MNKIEKLNESIRTLFRSEGEKFCYTPGEIERLVCSLNYKQLYSVLCDMAEPVFACCAGGGICDSHQYHSTKLFPANATLLWSDEGDPLGDDNLSTSYSNELWLLEDMTIAAASCFRVLNSAASYILKLISRQVLMAVSGAYRYREAEITITCGEPFKATMKMMLDAGWKKYSQKSIPQKWFSGLEVGQILTPSKVSVKDGKTQPPHHYTEDLLLSSMETAGATDMPEDAERKGLGTPATRAGILEKLVSTGMLERRKVKKQTILVPTELGNALITVLPEQLQSPLLTAEWENRLSQVQKGELEPEEFLDGIRGMLTDLVRDYRPVSGADILFPSAENTVGKCPRCGRPVIERSKGYFCTGQDCKFVLWRDSRFFTLKQKTLDKKTAQLLLEKGRAPLKGCVSSKTGKVYDASVVLEDDGERAHFRLVFGNG